MSTSTMKICFNPVCKDVKSERLRKGWRLRAGDFAELCDRCASAYEEGRFCETFHFDADGWRNCESCRKRLHCGCIVSVHSFVLLDAGGLECTACARKNLTNASNHIWPPSTLLSQPLSQRLKESPIKNGNPIAGPNAVARKWWEPPYMRHTTAVQSELHGRIPYEVDRSNSIDKLIAGARPSTSSLEKKKYEDPYEKVMSSSLELSALDRHANGNAGVDMVAASNTFHREEVTLDGLQGSCYLSGQNNPVDTRKGVISEPGLNTSVGGMTYDIHPNSGINVSLQSSTSKDDRSTPHFGVAVPYTSPSETNGPTRGSGSQSQRQKPPLAKQFYANPHNGVESSGETQIRNGRPRGDARGRSQLLPRYWPRITDQELQQISGDSNSIITPLFEKMLSASDAGRIGRLVLPKKCAEAYFPTISQPEGLPLKVQDAKGKEWVFQFRFWPNNNSRMYVLEGVTPCIHSMQLQAGDTVTFSRIDPEGKLVMGFRKASSSIPPSDQDNQTLQTGNSVSTNAEVNATDPASTWSKVDKSGYVAKTVPGAKSSLVPSKRKCSTLGSKSKRLRIENEDLIELKLTWEKAQGLLRPPPNHIPSIVVIEGHEFEEYEEAPILGKPTIFMTDNFGEKVQWAQCEDCSKWRKLPVDALLPSRWTCSDNLWDPRRSSCSSDQELTRDQLNSILSSSTAASKKTKSAKKESNAVEASEGLDTLANLAILGEGEALAPSAQATTKHPRHRPGCSCIVCIQPPSGKGPKHRDTCTCNVCLTVKRRFRTLMERRGKRQSEKEAETTQKLQQQPEKPEQEDDLNQIIMTNGNIDDNSNNKLTSTFKGKIDLNIQPEREDEPSPVSDSDNITRLLRNATELYLRQQRLASSAFNRDLIIDQRESGGGGAVGEKLDSGIPHGSDQLGVDADCSVTLPRSMSASTSATG